MRRSRNPNGRQMAFIQYRPATQMKAAHLLHMPAPPLLSAHQNTETSLDDAGASQSRRHDAKDL